MRKLFLFLVVLFLSFQQLTLAAIKEMTSTPDSVYLFSFATSGDDGRSGLRFAWSTDKENWFEIGRNYGYLRCDYSRWGSQKKMLDPYLKQSSDGEWICTWKLNDHDGYGQATSKDLINWTSQKYPRTTPDFDGVRVKAIVAGEEQKGNINRVVWTLVDGLDKNYGWNQCLCCQVYNDSRFIFVKQADDDFPICYRVVNEHKSISKFFQAFQSIMFQGDIVIVGNAVYTDDLQFCIVRQKPFGKIRSDKAGNSSYQNCFAVQYYIVG